MSLVEPPTSPAVVIPYMGEGAMVVGGDWKEEEEP